METDNPYFRPSYRGKFWEHRLSHFPDSILRDIYPLTRPQYRSANLARRASYAYLIQTVEACSTACEEARALLGDWVPKSMHETFVGVGLLGILPRNLGDDLAGLSELRNRVVHKNNPIDSKLVLYDRLLDLICAGYGAYEAFMALDLARIQIDVIPTCVVDRQYVRAHIRVDHDDPSKAARAHRRLDSETRVPRYVIEDKRIRAFLRLVQTKGNSD